MREWWTVPPAATPESGLLADLRTMHRRIEAAMTRHTATIDTALRDGPSCPPWHAAKSLLPLPRSPWGGVVVIVHRPVVKGHTAKRRAARGRVRTWCWLVDRVIPPVVGPDEVFVLMDQGRPIVICGERAYAELERLGTTPKES